MALKPSNKRNPNFSMSSLTDIIFLLLIFFMLTSNFVTPNALNLVLPSSDSKTVIPQTISVSINKDLNYFVGTTEVPLENIQALLEEQLEEQKDATVVLNADKSVPIEKVVEVMNIAHDMKVQMILATTPSR